MTDVFLSYSRKDKPFVQSLYDALHREQRETWVDWEAIEHTEDWWQAIERGIEGTSTFVFIISPDSVASDPCCREIDHAVKHHKRLVPIVHREGFETSKVHPMLSKHNWLFFRQTDDFAYGFGQLMTAIDTDLEQVRTHTRILEKAIEWDKEGRNPSFVLRGEDLVRSQAWLVQADQKEPKPTKLQREYISASQTNEEAAAILLKAGQQAKRLVQIGSGVLVATLIGAGVAGSWALRATDEAKAGTRIERIGAVAIRRFETDQADGLRLAMQAGFELQKWVRGKSLGQYPALSPILALQSGLEKIKGTRLSGNQGSVRSVTFSPDGSRIATGGEDGSTKLWDKDGKPITTLTSNQGSVYSVAFSPDGSRIAATGGRDGSIKLWDKDGKDGKPITSNQGSVYSVAFSPDGSRIATGGGDGSTKLWDKDGKPITTLNSDQGSVLSVAFSPDGSRIATGGYDGSIKLWDKDGKDGKPITSNQGNVYSVAFSPDGSRIATGGEDGSIKLWDKDGKPITTLTSNQGSVYSVAFSPDGSRIATGGYDGSTKLWDKDGKPITSITTNQGNVYSVAFSPDGSRIATGGYDGSTKLWDKDGKPITTLTSNQGNVYSVAFSPDGSRIAATGGRDGNTKLWDKDGKPITTLNSDQGSVYSVAFSPDGSRIATGGDDDSTKLWDRDGKPITTINSNQGIVLSVAFSPDGSRIATGGLDGSTKLWDKDGKPITTINSNQRIVLSVAFSPDGSRIATGGKDGSTKLWDRDGNQLGQFEGGSPTFSPDWQTIAVVTKPSYFGAPLLDSKDTIVQLYRIDLNLDSLLRRACQRLKTYILDDPKQTNEQKQCETHLGESWQAQRTSK